MDKEKKDKKGKFKLVYEEDSEDENENLESEKKRKREQVIEIDDDENENPHNKKPQKDTKNFTIEDQEEEEDEEIKRAIRLSLLSSDSINSDHIISDDSLSDEGNNNSNHHNRNNSNSNDFNIKDEFDENIVKEAIRLSLLEGQDFTTTPTSHNNQGLTFETGSTFYRNKLKGVPEYLNRGALSFTDILGKDMESAFLTSFVDDIQWAVAMIKKVTGKYIPTTIVRHWDSTSGDTKGFHVINSNLTVLHPPKPFSQFCTIHAKLILLVFPDFLRVCVTSANLRSDDWERLGQCIWVQDFPKRKDASPLPHSQFLTSLMSFIKSLGASGVFLKRYNFSKAGALLVPSVPGYFKDEELNFYGHMCLRNHIEKYVCKSKSSNSSDTNSSSSSSSNKEKAKKSKNPEHLLSSDVYFQMSSIGSLTQPWVNEFQQSVHSKKMSLLFPSFEEVRKSSDRVANGWGVLFLAKKTWESDKFPKDIMHHCYWNGYPSKSRDLVSMHSKVMVSIDRDKTFNWAYMGSHNFSGAAWGRLQKNNTQLHISNYELGVILLNDEKYSIDQNNDNNNNNNKNDNDNDGNLNTRKYSGESTPLWAGSIPFHIPPIPYKNGEQPWIQEKYNE